MNLGGRGEALLKAREELRLVAYKPTPNDRWTIGWGHTKGVVEGMKITLEQAQRFFEEDVADAIAAVRTYVKVPLSQAMFDALVCLVFNAGAGAIDGDSTIGRALNVKAYFLAYRGFSAYTKQAGIDLRGLARRRAEEMLLFMDDRLP